MCVSRHPFDTTGQSFGKPTFVGAIQETLTMRVVSLRELSWPRELVPATLGERHGSEHSLNSDSEALLG